KHFGAPINLAATFFNSQANRDQALTSRTTIPGTTTTTAVPGSKAAEPNQVGNFGGFEPDVAVADDGTVYAAWPAGTANITPGLPNGVVLSKSTDHGKTWTSSLALPYSYNNDSFIKLGWTPGGGSQGTVHISYPGIPK